MAFRIGGGFAALVGAALHRGVIARGKQGATGKSRRPRASPFIEVPTGVSFARTWHVAALVSAALHGGTGCKVRAWGVVWSRR